jgi:hypothetical protein
VNYRRPSVDAALRAFGLVLDAELHGAAALDVAPDLTVLDVVRHLSALWAEGDAWRLHHVEILSAIRAAGLAFSAAHAEQFACWDPDDASLIVRFSPASPELATWAKVNGRSAYVFDLPSAGFVFRQGERADAVARVAGDAAAGKI